MSTRDDGETATESSVSFKEAGEALDAMRHGEPTRDFEHFLHSRVVGQDAAIEAVTELYQVFLSGMAPPDRPVGNLLFLGPTGSGKTYVVEVIAEALFGNPHAFTKINCAEFQEHHEIAKLIGSPPGYVGHMQTPPLLTQDALNRWHTEKQNSRWCCLTKSRKPRKLCGSFCSGSSTKRVSPSAITVTSIFRNA